MTSPIDEHRINCFWQIDATGRWLSPDGISEADWAELGRPLPEDPDYAEFADTYFHYEKLDSLG